ncbi:MULTISPECIES: hypothetical protein [Streptomyces]|uniref:hypothetical protein n=1 Tax=unclassified Streptomyces TaxID=2593676 RepID=UPI000A70B338|nr:hypothetical protein [Streptomyces sp. NRRL B-24720]
MSTTREHSEARLLSPSLMFIALVVVAVAGLGTPLHPLHRMHEFFLTGGSR